MSSAGGDGDGGSGGSSLSSASPRQYFCHQCNRNVSISPSPSSDLLCPNCNGGFLEELEIPIPNPNPPNHNPFFSEFPLAGTATVPLVLPGATTAPLDDLSALFGTRSDEPLNPLLLLQHYFQTLRAGGGNFQVVIESGDPAGAFRFPAGGGNVTHGDYFFGPGLEELIQHLAENDPNRYGTPPASKSAVEGLPDVAVTEELLASDSSQCAVCKDTFGLGETAKQMPCKHIYHNDCIMPWLELHNSCPVCRYELPTDDPDYEQRARRGGGAGGGGGGSGGAVPPVNWNLAVGGAGGSADSSGGGDNSQRRRFRVSLPWPFRQFVSNAAETSNVASANNENNSNNDSGNNGGGQSNSGNGGNRNFESETRQEDLD